MGVMGNYTEAERDAVRFTLRDEYSRLEIEGVDRFQVYANILAIKQEYEIDDGFYSVYQDVKRWIRMFFEDLAEKDFGYDSLKIEPFAEVIDRLPTEQALRLYSILHHHCDKNHYSSDEVIAKIEGCQKKLWRDNKNWIHLWLYNIANNAWILSVIGIIYLIIVTCSFLPAPIEPMECLNVKMLDWPDENFGQSLLRYIFNAFYFIIHGVTDEAIVTPANWRGVIVLALWEFVFWGLIINFLYQKAVGRLQNSGFADRDIMREEKL